MRGKLILLVLVLVGAYYFFVLSPQPHPVAKPAGQPSVQPGVPGQPLQAPVPSVPKPLAAPPAANPAPSAGFVSCDQRLAALKQFAAANASCETADDCVPVQVAVAKGESDCQVLVDAVLNIDKVDAFDDQANGFFGAGCGDNVAYCPVQRDTILDTRCVGNRCVWAPIVS